MTIPSRRTVTCLLLSAGLGATLMSQDAARPQPAAAARAAENARMIKELSNWGRWGANDELGTLNLITPTKRVQAAKLVKDGATVSLARQESYEPSIDTEPWVRGGIPGNGAYELNMMPPAGNFANSPLDWIVLRYHGYAHTHLDAIGHAGGGGEFYNGYKDVIGDKERYMKEGLSKLSVFVAKDGIVTRGVLMDIPRLKGVPYLEPTDRIYPADLEAWERKAGVKVSAGDALFIRTGRWARRAQVGPWDVSRQSAGIDGSVVPWLRKRDIALLGSENTHDAHPGNGSGPGIHGFGPKYLGLHVIDNVALDAVADAAAARKRWEFLVTIAPLPTPGATGSPVNPIATF